MEVADIANMQNELHEWAPWITISIMIIKWMAGLEWNVWIFCLMLSCGWHAETEFKEGLGGGLDNEPNLHFVPH